MIPFTSLGMFNSGNFKYVIFLEKEYWINQKVSLAGKTNFTDLSIWFRYGVVVPSWVQLKLLDFVYLGD